MAWKPEQRRMVLPIGEGSHSQEEISKEEEMKPDSAQFVGSICLHGWSCWVFTLMASLMQLGQ
jgi:hypothetical protein